jgi:tryptophan-rich sensory protein
MRKYILPPTWVFGIWLFLYPVFAYAFYELWKVDRTTYGLFLVSLILNILAGSSLSQVRSEEPPPCIGCFLTLPGSWWQPGCQVG